MTRRPASVRRRGSPSRPSLRPPLGAAARAGRRRRGARGRPRPAARCSALVGLLAAAPRALPGRRAAPAADPVRTLACPRRDGACLLTPAPLPARCRAVLLARARRRCCWPAGRTRRARGHAAPSPRAAARRGRRRRRVAAARDLATWLVAPRARHAAGRRAGRPAPRPARRRTAPLTLLITSLTSFGLLALGAALWLAATGRRIFAGRHRARGRAAAPSAGRSLVLGVLLAVAGVGFKLSLVPFHAWTPRHLRRRPAARRRVPRRRPRRSPRWPPCSSSCRPVARRRRAGSCTASSALAGRRDR